MAETSFKEDVKFVTENNPGECYMEYAKLLRQMRWKAHGGIYWLAMAVKREVEGRL